MKAIPATESALLLAGSKRPLCTYYPRALVSIVQGKQLSLPERTRLQYRFRPLGSGNR